MKLGMATDVGLREVECKFSLSRTCRRSGASGCAIHQQGNKSEGNGTSHGRHPSDEDVVVEPRQVLRRLAVLYVLTLVLREET